MPDDDLINLLPRRLRPRFEGFNSYVGSILEEEMPEHRLAVEAMQLVQFVAFVGALINSSEKVPEQPHRPWTFSQD